jgi:hypothetical protein
MDTTTNWLIAITQNLIATLIAYVFARWLRSRKASIHTVKGVASKAGRMIQPSTLRAVVDVMAMWFILTQLRNSIQDPAPLTRMDVFTIAAWTWWALFLAVDIAFGPIFPQRDRAR